MRKVKFYTNPYKLLLFIFLYIGFILRLFAQQEASTTEVINRIDNNYYEMSITNNTDTVICVLTSMFIDNFSDTLSLGVYHSTNRYSKENNSTFIYSLIHLIEDNNISHAPFHAECIMPKQTVKIIFSIEKIRKKQIMLLYYFKNKKFSYSKFQKEIQNSRWHNKYNINSKEILF
ncbi:MAG: hypothetical protein JJT94_09785 [Bernardetiaceae bacterium]|nr:hypothetical protein [Bernardetiaceae bacterium]